MKAAWFAQMKRPVAEVAAAFGVPVFRQGTDVSFPCPVCGKVVRYSKGLSEAALERAPRAAMVAHGGSGWVCFANGCGAKGDAVALAAVLAVGAVKPATKKDWAEVRRKCAAKGLCDADPSDPRAPAARRYEPPPLVPMKAPELKRLPAAEVAALWAACSRLDAVPAWDAGGTWCGEARAYLAGRGLDVGALAAIDAARVVPPVELVASWPEWWRGWWGKTWRVAVPLYDATGVMVALQARALPEHLATHEAWVKRRLEADPKAWVKPATKTTNPKGPFVAGTFFADAGGLEVLRGTWSGPLVTVVEGLADFLAASQLAAGLEPTRRPAVLGVMSGSARALSGVRVNVSRLNVLTDNDKKGEEYFREVTAALPRLPWVRVRLRPLVGVEGRADLGDYLRLHPALALAALTHGTERQST